MVATSVRWSAEYVIKNGQDEILRLPTAKLQTEGLSQNIFISKYRLQLPSEDDIRKYMLENITEEDFKNMQEGR